MSKKKLSVDDALDLLRNYKGKNDYLLNIIP